MPIKLCKYCDQPRAPKLRECRYCHLALVELRNGATKKAQLAGIPPASGRCTECHARQATLRYRETWREPLKLRNVCRSCIRTLGEPKDTREYVMTHRRISVPLQQMEDANMPTLPSRALLFDYLVREFSRSILSQALIASRGRMECAADILGVSERTLNNHMRTFRVKRDGTILPFTGE